nr:unnamed protein product [Callosobruchus analis]
MAASTVNFVHAIEQHACLYNNKLPEYSRRDLTEKAWNEVAQKTNMSVNDCQIKWKNIRNGFVRSPSGSSTKQKKLYYLHEELQFVLPFVKPVVHTNEPGNITAPPSATEDIERNSLSEDEEPAEISQSSEMSCSQHISGTFRKPKIRKVTNEADKAFVEWVKRKETKNESSRKMFLLSSRYRKLVRKANA